MYFISEDVSANKQGQRTTVSVYGSWGLTLGFVSTLCSLLWAEPLGTSVLDLLDSGGLHTGSLGGDGLSCLAFSVEDGLTKRVGDLDTVGVSEIRLGVGPFGVVVFLELRGPRGVLGAVRGVRGPLLDPGVEGADLGVLRAVLGAVAGDLGVMDFPQPSRVLSVILLG